jgi:hypothetical protein
MKKDETVKEMYNRMKKITNQIKSLGGDKWGDREIVDKLLTVYMARDVKRPPNQGRLKSVTLSVQGG